MTAQATTHTYLNPVRSEHAEAFEAFLRNTAVPAIAEHAPQQSGRWQVLRSTSEDDGVVTFAFVFDGSDIEEWNLEALLVKAHGDAEARRLMVEFGEGMHGDQYGWSFAPVALT